MCVAYRMPSARRFTCFFLPSMIASITKFLQQKNINFFVVCVSLISGKRRNHSYNTNHVSNTLVETILS